jgi:EAL domain-containing protein (putative c-di-GMP-specific phosphodiesterase class I)
METHDGDRKIPPSDDSGSRGGSDFAQNISASGEATPLALACASLRRHVELGVRQRVVAEGVETLEQLEFIEAQRRDEAQGYYFSRPLPAQQFAMLVRPGISVPTLH